jgi:hypothetical protein
MTVKRMDNVGIVVESLDSAVSFFGRVTRLRDQRVEIAMMRTPDGHSRLELSRFLTPPVVADHRKARRTSTIRSPGSASAARSSSAKWSSTKTRIGSATSGGPKDFSSGSPKNARVQIRA